MFSRPGEEECGLWGYQFVGSLIPKSSTRMPVVSQLDTTEDLLETYGRRSLPMVLMVCFALIGVEP